MASQSVWRRGAGVVLGIVLVALAFPAVWWWGVTRTMSRALTLDEDLGRRVLARPTPSGEVPEVAACARAVVDALPEPLQSFDPRGKSLVPWFRGTSPLSTLSAPVRAQLEVLKQAGPAFRRCAGAREVALGQAELGALHRKLRMLVRGNRLLWLEDLREGRADDVARECVETLSVLTDLSVAFSGTEVFPSAVEELAPACVQAVQEQSPTSRERLRSAWSALPARATTNALLVETRFANLVPFYFSDFVPTRPYSLRRDGVWGRVTRGRVLGQLGRAFERFLVLADTPGPERVAASETVDAVANIYPLMDGAPPGLEALVSRLEHTRLVLSALSAVANEAPMPAGVTLTDTELVVGELELRKLVERVP